MLKDIQDVASHPDHPNLKNTTNLPLPLQVRGPGGAF